MKILYIARNHCDHLQDMLFHGLRTIYGADCVDVPKLEAMYDSQPAHERKNNYGAGFGIYNTLPDIVVDRSNIPLRLSAGEFDIVVFAGDITYYPNRMMLEREVFDNMPMRRVAIVDGNDKPYPSPHIKKGVYFKNDMSAPADCITQANQYGVFPMPFAFPRSKFRLPSNQRIKLFSYYEPGMAYMYQDEKQLYDDYHTSYFAVTRKKECWDAQRHYEIMSQGCIPFFEDILKRPAGCCVTLPHKILEHVATSPAYHAIYATRRRLLENPDSVRRLIEEYKVELDALAAAVYNHAVAECTTEALARYFLANMANYAMKGEPVC